jgi:hypothetical protein
MFKKYISLILFVSFFLISSEAMAQGGTPPCPDGSPQPCSGPPNPPGTPIDGGIAILLAAGAAYGIKKLRE